MGNDRQAILTAGIDFSREVGLELGPLNRPVVRREAGRVIYVDYTDTATLRQRYASDPNVRVEDIVDVDATWGGNTLQDALGQGVKVDYIVASHVIEHVPDLIAWLGELSDVLQDHGKIRLAVPDRRFSFDYLRGETRLADIICAHMVHARVPQPHEVLDFTLNKTQIDTLAAWDQLVVVESLGRDFTYEGCMHLAHDVVMNATYHDVHCWVFTPASFARLMHEMATHGLTTLGCESFTDTAYGEFEFFVSAVPMDDQDRCVASWQKMEKDARASQGAESAPQAKLDELMAALSRRDVEAAEGADALAAMSDAIDCLKDDNSRLAADLRAYERSRSWRLTAPLRAIFRLLTR